MLINFLILQQIIGLLQSIQSNQELICESPTIKDSISKDIHFLPANMGNKLSLQLIFSSRKGGCFVDKPRILLDHLII